MTRYGATRPLNVHIQRLRLKLGEARDYIDTVIGIGYGFVNLKRYANNKGMPVGASSTQLEA